MDTTIVAARQGRIGRLTLNRPQALNALDLPMIRALRDALAAWRDDPAVHALVIDSASPRAFCAGGDIRAMHGHAIEGASGPIEAFFSNEYALNQAIADYPVPFVALIDGVCLGGGIGVSVHGRIRVATEHASFAMPETAIALFPDVGTTYVLPRLPGALGMFLALTGTRLVGPDAVHAGLATHFVTRERLHALSAALASEGVAAVAAFASPLPAFTLAPHRDAIDRCFGTGTVGDIVARLEREGGDWAAATLRTLRIMSPSSVVWSHRIVTEGAGRTLPQCLAAELALTRTVTRHPDFAEGVRAMVIDKDRAPKWSPPRLEDMRHEDIDALFVA